MVFMEKKATFEQDKLFYSKLEGEVKKEFFIDYFVSHLCFALKERRKELGITQKDIADAMGTKQSYISKLENFERTPTIETVARYCYALRLSLDEAEAFKESLTHVDEDLPRFRFSASKKND